MVTRLTDGKSFPSDVLEHILAKTDGVPLFVEELTKTVLESGFLREMDDRYELTGPLPPLAIPTTLQDALMARLDRLAPVKEVAQSRRLSSSTTRLQGRMTLSPNPSLFNGDRYSGTTRGSTLSFVTASVIWYASLADLHALYELTIAVALVTLGGTHHETVFGWHPCLTSHRRSRCLSVFEPGCR